MPGAVLVNADGAVATEGGAAVTVPSAGSADDCTCCDGCCEDTGCRYVVGVAQQFTVNLTLTSTINGVTVNATSPVNDLVTGTGGNPTLCRMNPTGAKTYASAAGTLVRFTSGVRPTPPFSGSSCGHDLDSYSCLVTASNTSVFPQGSFQVYVYTTRGGTATYFIRYSEGIGGVATQTTTGSATATATGCCPGAGVTSLTWTPPTSTGVSTITITFNWVHAGSGCEACGGGMGAMMSPAYRVGLQGALAPRPGLAAQQWAERVRALYQHVTGRTFKARSPAHVPRTQCFMAMLHRRGVSVDEVQDWMRKGAGDG